MPPSHKTFLVESYVPQLDYEAAVAITLRLRSAVRQLESEGAVVRWLRSFALVGEDTYLCVIAASDADDAVRLNVRARVEYDHVVEVVAFDSSPLAAARGS